MTSFNLIMVSAFHEMGGNCLHRFLDSHPQLMVTPFESTLGTSLSSNLMAGPVHWMPQRYSYPEFASEWTPEQAYHAMADHELKPYLRARQTSKFKDCGLVMDEKKRIERFKYHTRFGIVDGSPRGSQVFTQALRLVNHRTDYVAAFFRSTFETWENFNRTGEETHYVGYIPPILLDTDKFFADFPNGHMIHVIRNPWSGYADTLKRPYPFSLERYCQMWNVCSMQARVYEAKYRGRFHTIRAEDLFSDPLILNRICADIGLKPFEGTPQPSFNRKPLSQVYPWGTIKHPTAEANVATARELSRDQIEQIYVETLPMAFSWGYLDFLNYNLR